MALNLDASNFIPDEGEYLFNSFYLSQSLDTAIQWNGKSNSFQVKSKKSKSNFANVPDTIANST
jgi:hypothetical protein